MAFVLFHFSLNGYVCLFTLHRTNPELFMSIGLLCSCNCVSWVGVGLHALPGGVAAVRGVYRSDSPT